MVQHVMTAISAIIAAVCGAAIGVLFTVAHRATVPVGPVELPYGIVLGLLSVVALLTALRLLWDTRWPTVGAAVGIVAATLALSFDGPGGSVVVSADGYGWTWIIAPAVIGALAIAWPRALRRRAASGGEDTIDGLENAAEERQ